jgi:hypothetical protein
MTLRKLAIVLLAASPALAVAQTSTNNAYAITSKQMGGFEWTEVKEINLTNGEIVRNVFDNSITNFNLIDGRSSRPIVVPTNTDSTKENRLHPFAGLSAACAYDKKLNRLYYVPMFINQLRYIDLNSGVPSVYLFQNENFSNVAGTESEAEPNQFTRMVIASDGNGYAMTNDGMHLVRFTTDKNPVISDLGQVNDAAENGEISIHDANTSWGGDMVADASGNLYVISAVNHVFKIDLQTKTATFIKKIKGLPEGFTSNGAVVNEKGNVVLSSANYLTSYYQVDPYSWEATNIPAGDFVHNTSDLANENLLFKTNLEKNEELTTLNEKISLYPNPVTSSSFRITFENKESGNYNVQLIDVAGRMVSGRSVAVFTGLQTSEVRLDRSVAKGMYMVKVLNGASREVYMKKIVVL